MIFVFEGSGAGWCLRTSYHNGTIEDVKQRMESLLTQDLRQSGECADRILLVQVINALSERSAAAVQFETHSKSVELTRVNAAGEPLNA